MVTKAQMFDIESLSRPLIEYINNNFNPHTEIVIKYDRIDVLQKLCGMPITEYIKD